ncbi:hypothetical protein K503DRAFT_701726, partial [Rhizopogon vinicolor AM-OR11-026]
MAQKFSVQNLAALYCSVFAEGFSNSERQAVARALLRHGAHLDGTHYHTRKPGGLHPSYAAFNSFVTTKDRSLTHEELVEASLQDVFDSIAVQDRLDGGLSLLIRCPGFKADTTPPPEEVAVDLYVTPRELHESTARIGGDVAVLLTDVYHHCAGAAINHQQRVAEVRALIRSEINQALQNATQDPDAKMQWAQYWRNVVRRHSVVIEGWPEQIPFVNLSAVSNSLTDLE